MSKRPLASRLLPILPKRALTELAGRAAGLPLPRALRKPVYTTYASAVGADLEEAGAPLDSFGSFNEFFARPLREGLRDTDVSAELVSPADGRLAAQGTIQDGQLLQAKGLPYTLNELLCDDSADARYEGGAYATVYLSPADYHRVHTPAPFVVNRVVHEPGELWPVNQLSVPWIDGLFRRNERVVFHGHLATGEACALVMVAATVVGQIVVRTPGVELERVRERRDFPLDPAWNVASGEELGAFLLGSTAIVVVAPSDRGPWRLRPEEGARLRMGEALFDLEGA